jgi:transcription antitermination factor NusG
MTWYVVHVQAGRELFAAGLLERNLGLDVYYPEVLQPRRGQRQRIALFPGYLFLAADWRHSAPGDVDRTPGVVRLVRGGDATPAAIADTVVDALRTRTAAIDAAGGLPAHPFHPGDRVEITDGPLQGLEAVFLGPLTAAARVQVLLQFLGQEQQVEVPVDLLVPRAAPLPTPPVHRPRRTRGKGRRVTGDR